MSEDIEKSLIENARGPKSVSSDAGSVEQHSLAEQILVDKYLASKKAAASKGLGIKLLKISPSSAI